LACNPDVARALIVKLNFTFALCYGVSNVATAKAGDGNFCFGLAILPPAVATEVLDPARPPASPP
jgi:hypothetical protein